MCVKLCQRRTAITLTSTRHTVQTAISQTNCHVTTANVTKLQSTEPPTHTSPGTTPGCVRGAPPLSAANRLHGQRTWTFSWRPVLRPFQQDRPIPTRPYPEQRTWTAASSKWNQCITSHSGNALTSPDMRPTQWLCPACITSTTSIAAHTQPTIAMTTTHIHQLWRTLPPYPNGSLPLHDRITYRHRRQPKLPTFLYSSNTTSWRLMRRANNNNNNNSSAFHAQL